MLLLSVTPFGLRAQSNLFDLETDTVCVRQPLHIIPHAMNATSYYWGFCSGYLQSNTPLMDNLGSGFGLNNASSMEIAKDGDNFYGFVVNEATTELLRFEYGNSLVNTPTITNFGNLDLTLSPSPNSIYLTQDSGKWYLFICGGRTQPASISRFDFGTRLSNVPNGVRMGNPGGLLNDPRGIFVAKQGTQYYGFVVNAGNNRLIRLSFGDNISRTPTAQNVTLITGFPAAALNGPRDIAPIYDNGSWYFFVPNLTNNSISRLYFGNTLTNNPAITTVAGGTMGTSLNQPSAISLIKDCGEYYAYITNRGNDRILRYSVPALTSNWSFSQSFSPTNVFFDPADITHIIRDRDSLFIFVLNGTGNSLARVIFPQCHDASIQSSMSPVPPPVSYSTPGLYNVYLAINEGQPNMNMDCKQVRVVAIPPITISNDSLICQGDTMRIEVASQYATGYFYSPNINISDTVGSRISVYPDRKTTYNVRIPIIDGCIVDTSITVDVSRVQADAGPDRTLRDGASTVIGGPNTYKGPQYTYEWFPAQYIDNIFSLTPTVNPPTDLTYYLRVTNTDRCVDIDTVNVRIGCSELTLPNAFAPANGAGAPNRFGLLNKQIVQLNYFRIFDRWGKLVFSTSDITKQWDGTIGGDPAPFGVYVWTADGFCASGERLNRSGNVTLMR